MIELPDTAGVVLTREVLMHLVDLMALTRDAIAIAYDVVGEEGESPAFVWLDEAKQLTFDAEYLLANAPIIQA